MIEILNKLISEVIEKKFYDEPVLISKPQDDHDNLIDKLMPNYQNYFVNNTDLNEKGIREMFGDESISDEKFGLFIGLFETDEKRFLKTIDDCLIEDGWAFLFSSGTSNLSVSPFHLYAIISFDGDELKAIWPNNDIDSLYILSKKYSAELWIQDLTDVKKVKKYLTFNQTEEIKNTTFTDFEKKLILNYSYDPPESFKGRGGNDFIQEKKLNTMEDRLMLISNIANVRDENGHILSNSLLEDKILDEKEINEIIRIAKDKSVGKLIGLGEKVKSLNSSYVDESTVYNKDFSLKNGKLILIENYVNFKCEQIKEEILNNASEYYEVSWCELGSIITVTHETLFKEDLNKINFGNENNKFLIPLLSNQSDVFLYDKNFNIELLDDELYASFTLNSDNVEPKYILHFLNSDFGKKITYLSRFQNNKIP